MARPNRDELLQGFFREECEAIGPENLIPILENRFRLVRTEYGENLPLGEVVGIVVAAVGFIDASLSLRERLKRPAESESVDVEAFVSLARSELKIPDELDDQRVEAILRRIAGKQP
jgi:hypothetical protein